MTMLKIEQKPSGSDLHLTLSGQIDEAARYEGIKTEGFKRIVINFEGIKLINSTGLQAWIKFFSTIATGAEIAFERCSVRVITQINMFPGFMAGRKVAIDSFYAPYFCETCDQSCDVLIEADLHKDTLAKIKAPAMNCPRCGGPAEFDGIEKKYLMFLKNKNS